MPSPLPTEFCLPKPVLSVQPGHEVAAGADVMLHCTIRLSKVVCFLYLEGQATALKISVEHTDFYLSRMDHSKGGRYSCQCYTEGTPINWSGVSNMLELVVRGENPPSATSCGTRNKEVEEQSGCNRGISFLQVHLGLVSSLSRYR